MWHRLKIVSYAKTGNVCRGGMYGVGWGWGGKGRGFGQEGDHISTKLPQLLSNGTKHQKLPFVWRIRLLSLFFWIHFPTRSAVMTADVHGSAHDGLRGALEGGGAGENTASAFKGCSSLFSIPLVPPQPPCSSAHSSVVCYGSVRTPVLRALTGFLLLHSVSVGFVSPISLPGLFMNYFVIV